MFTWIDVTSVIGATPAASAGVAPPGVGVLLPLDNRESGCSAKYRRSELCSGRTPFWRDRVASVIAHVVTSSECDRAPARSDGGGHGLARCSRWRPAISADKNECRVVVRGSTKPLHAVAVTGDDEPARWRAEGRVRLRRPISTSVAGQHTQNSTAGACVRGRLVRPVLGDCDRLSRALWQSCRTRSRPQWDPDARRRRPAVGPGVTRRR